MKDTAHSNQARPDRAGADLLSTCAPRTRPRSTRCGPTTTRYLLAWEAYLHGARQRPGADRLAPGRSGGVCGVHGGVAGALAGVWMFGTDEFAHGAIPLLRWLRKEANARGRRLTVRDPAALRDRDRRNTVSMRPPEFSKLDDLPAPRPHDRLLRIFPEIHWEFEGPAAATPDKQALCVTKTTKFSRVPRVPRVPQHPSV